MDKPISATELVRRLGDVLGRIRYRGESFVVERNGTPIARLSPIPAGGPGTLREALEAWRAGREPDASYAEDLEAVRASDIPPTAAWDS
jgi:antitoxin (DNA-binding transcriptional repressor) of toxin-antitoxin stability system